MKCSSCGTTKDVRRIKHLPLPNGESGHITLTNWTDYCPACIALESEKFDAIVEAAVKKITEGMSHKNAK